MKAIEFGMLSKEDQLLYDGILHACKKRDFQELKRCVSQFTGNGHSMRDVYFKTQYEDISSIPESLYPRIQNLLSIGCHYVLTPLSSLVYSALEQSTQSYVDILDMMTYLLEHRVDPNISILIYLPVPNRRERKSKRTPRFPFALDFNYDFAKVMYYESLLSITAIPSVHNISNPSTEIETIKPVLLYYGASQDISPYNPFLC